MTLRRNELGIAVVKRWMENQGRIEIRSQGTSMFPFIREGDLCQFQAMEEQRDCNRLRRGDILLFVSGDSRLIGHRLHREERRPEGQRYRFKGDSNLRADEWVDKSQIVGKLVAIQRNHRTIHVARPVPLLWSWLMIHLPWISVLIRLALRIKRQRA